MESTETYKRPSRRIAALLGFFFPPLGMLYVARPGLAAIYFVLSMVAPPIALLLVPRERAWFLGVGVALLLVLLVCAVQAWRFARDFREVRRPWYSHGPGLAFVIVTFIGMVTGSRAWLYEPFRLGSSPSMLPSIEPGAVVVTQKWGYGNYGTWGIHFARGPITSELNRGDVVVFESPENRSVDFVKRVVGLPGDTVAYFSKRLWVNDQEVPRTRVGDYLMKDRASGMPRYLERLGQREYPVLIDAGEANIPQPKNFPLIDHCTFTKEGMSCRVPPGHYFVLGDNRDNSIDSRTWGFVPAENIVGKVQWIVQ